MPHRNRIAMTAVALLLWAQAGAQTAQKPTSLDPARLVVKDAAQEAESTAVEGMVLVPAGEFKMGSSPHDEWAEPNEMPQRVVVLPDFYIDRFEVSNIEYKRFMQAMSFPPPITWNGDTYPEDAEFYPVTGVSWWEATAYARWAGKRLPTEAEWEKAARGTDGRRFPWGEDFDSDRANIESGMLPVASKMEGASVYGAVNMAGNVAEWTATVYAPYPKTHAALPSEFGGSSRLAAPAVPSGGATLSVQEAKQSSNEEPLLRFFTAQELKDTRDRTYRGGSFDGIPKFLRCASRRHADPGARWDNVGFRCAMDPGASKPQGR